MNRTIEVLLDDSVEAELKLLGVAADTDPRTGVLLDDSVEAELKPHQNARRR